jgi:adenylate cyclase
MSLVTVPRQLVSIFASRRLVALLLLAALISLRLSDPAPLEELRLRSFDLFQTIQPRNDRFRPVTIVDIDEASLSTYGQWPWPRTLIAELLNRLDALQVKGVAFDVVFSEPDRSSPNEAMKYFNDLDEATRARLLELPTNDQVFAQAIRAGRVVLGQAGMRATDTPKPERLPETGTATIGPDPTPYLISFPRLLRNLPELERAAAGRGLFTIATERDGMVRRVPLVMMAEGKIVPALTVELLRTATGASTVLVRSDESGVRTVAVPGLELPTDQNARVWVHFAPHDMAKYVSAKDVLTGRAPPDKFADKLVLIGTSAIGLLDLKTTPVHSAMPGVEIHAQLLEAALTDSLLMAPGYAMVIELLAAGCAGVLLALLAPAVGALALLAIAAVIIGSFLATSWTLYSSYRILIDPTFPVLAALSIYVSLVLIGYFREQMDRRRIRSAFSQYLSPNLVEQLASSPHKLVLGGEERNMTVLFSDIRGFTGIAENFRNDPAGLTTLINRLLTPLTNAIISCNGTIDKYMGDAVMAFWNAPLDDPQHELDACSAALVMQDCVRTLNSERERESRENGGAFLPIKMGIGINTGRCVVGNMGSELRFQYTVMGDSVNLASRLEGQTAGHGVSVLIGSKTAQAVAEQFALVQADLMRVKGRKEPEVIYTIVGDKHMSQTDEFQSFRKHWDELISRYRQRDWMGATTLLGGCRAMSAKYGLTELAALYAERCEQFTRTPPPLDWAGVFDAETK